MPPMKVGQPTTLAKLAAIEALQAWLGIARSVQTRRQQQ